MKYAILIRLAVLIASFAPADCEARHRYRPRPRTTVSVQVQTVQPVVEYRVRTYSRPRGLWIRVN